MAQKGSKQKPQRSFWFTLARVLSFFLMPLFFPVRYHNKQIINALDAPFMLVANHASAMDPVVIALAVKRYEVHYLGKRELGKNGLFAYILREMHMIAVSRRMTDIAAMRACNEVLKSGNVLGIFPEGTRNKPEKFMKDVESGFALIALRNRVPLIPVYIHGKIGMFHITHIYFLPELHYEHIAGKGIGRDACDELSNLLTQTLMQAKADIEKNGKKT